MSKPTKSAVVFGVGPRQGVGAELCFRAAKEGLHTFRMADQKTRCLPSSMPFEQGSSADLWSLTSPTRRLRRRP